MMRPYCNVLPPIAISNSYCIVIASHLPYFRCIITVKEYILCINACSSSAHVLLFWPCLVFSHHIVTSFQFLQVQCLGPNGNDRCLLSINLLSPLFDQANLTPSSMNTFMLPSRLHAFTQTRSDQGPYRFQNVNERLLTWSCWTRVHSILQTQVHLPKICCWWHWALKNIWTVTWCCGHI